MAADARNRLIAAAPELLAACKVALDWLANATLDSRGKTQEEFDAAVDQVEEAIAKAVDP